MMLVGVKHCCSFQATSGGAPGRACRQDSGTARKKCDEVLPMLRAQQAHRLLAQAAVMSDVRLHRPASAMTKALAIFGKSTGLIN